MTGNPNTALIERLRTAQVGSCACHTKSHEVAYHETDCPYRLLEVCIRGLEATDYDQHAAREIADASARKSSAADYDQHAAREIAAAFARKSPAVKQ